MKGARYTATLVVEDVGDWPKISPSGLWDNMTVLLPTGLEITSVQVRTVDRRCTIELKEGTLRLDKGGQLI